MIANARMYALDDTVSKLWRRLFERVAVRAGVALDVVEHPAPRALGELWGRADLGCAFMCGYPWSTWQSEEGRPRLLAAPLPAGERYAGRPVYCTDIVVRRDSRHANVAALRGARFAFTIETSQSGWQAPRQYFAERALRAGGRWFGDLAGPLVTPRAVVDALIAGRADAGPLDSYWHDLLRRHEPATAAQLRTLARTPMTPMPALVCAASTPDAVHERLVDALAGVARDERLRDVRDALLLGGFVAVHADDYVPLARAARGTDRLGYVRLQ
jgi:ABC-type phosphate/phosphonate transport system substrate-binding protein